MTLSPVHFHNDFTRTISFECADKTTGRGEGGTLGSISVPRGAISQIFRGYIFPVDLTDTASANSQAEDGFHQWIRSMRDFSSGRTYTVEGADTSPFPGSKSTDNGNRRPSQESIWRRGWSRGMTVRFTRFFIMQGECPSLFLTQQRRCYVNRKMPAGLEDHKIISQFSHVIYTHYATFIMAFN